MSRKTLRRALLIGVVVVATLVFILLVLSNPSSEAVQNCRLAMLGLPPSINRNHVDAPKVTRSNYLVFSNYVADAGTQRLYISACLGRITIVDIQDNLEMKLQAQFDVAAHEARILIRDAQLETELQAMFVPGLEASQHLPDNKFHAFKDRDGGIQLLKLTDGWLIYAMVSSHSDEHSGICIATLDDGSRHKSNGHLCCNRAFQRATATGAELKDKAWFLAQFGFKKMDKR